MKLRFVHIQFARRTYQQMLTYMFLLATLGTQAQTIERQLIGSLAINNTSSNFTSSLGEVVVQTLSTASLTLTQGFQQGEMPEEVMPPPLGITNISQHLLAYPNPVPVNGKVTLEIANEYAKPMQLEIITLSGKRIAHQTDLFENNSTYEVDLNTIPAGHYNLLVYSTNRALIGVQKILITN